MSGYVYRDPARVAKARRPTTVILRPLTPEQARTITELELRVRHHSWTAHIKRLQAEHHARYSPAGRCEALLAATTGHVDPRKRSVA